MTAVEGNASVCQVHTVSGITCEGRADAFMSLGPGFEQEGPGGEGRGGGGGGNSISARKL